MSRQNNEERSYVAFISYRHKDLDREAALRVQKKIENYIVPKEFRDKTGGKKLGLCFRDEDELPASSSLSDSIYYALDHTEFLIVICTPDLPLSKWCEAEIRYFLKTHDRDHILAVLADGEPEESFSPYMLYEYNEAGEITGSREPLAANIAGEGHTIDGKAFKKEVIRICAALIGCPFDELWQRERRARTARLLTAGAVVFAVMAVFLIVVLNRNAMIEERNREIARQNQQISEQNDELQTRISTVYTDAGNNKLLIHDVDGAVTDGLNALESGDPDIYDHRTAKLLSDALCAYMTKEIQTRVVYEQSQPIRKIAVTDDEKIAAFTDESGILRGLDMETKEILWEIQTRDILTRIYTKGLGQKLIYMSENGATCVSLSDGSVLWAYEHPKDNENYVQALSADGQVFALADYDYDKYVPDDNHVDLVFLSTQDGHVLGRTDVIRDQFVYDRLSPPSNDYYKEESDIPVASFTDDGALFTCALPGTKVTGEGEEVEEVPAYAIFTVGLDDFSRTDVGILEGDFRFLYGIDADSKDESVFVAAYSTGMGGIFTGICTKDGDKYEYRTEITNHVFNSQGWAVDYSKYPENECHMLSDGDRIILFSNDEMFIFLRKENKVERLDSMTGIIADAYWIDKEAGVYETCMNDGSIMDFTLNKDEEDKSAFSHMTRGEFDFDKSWHTVPIRGGVLQNGENGAAVTIDGSSRGNILWSEYVSDENRMDFSLPDEYAGTVSSMTFVPDSDTVLVTCSKESILAMDRNTGEIKSQASYEEGLGYYFYGDVFPLDEESILIQNTRYGLDGKKEVYAEPVTFDDGTNVAEPDSHLHLDDGTVLSWTDTSALFLKSEYIRKYMDSFDGSVSQEEIVKLYTEEFDQSTKMNLVCFWRDGKPIEEFNEKDHMIVIAENYDDDDTFLKAGKSGLFMAFCRRWKFTEETYEAEDEEQFYFIDFSDGHQTVMENRFPDSGKITAAMGNKEHLAVVVYEDGTVCIYEPDENRTVQIEKKYAAGEVLASTFSGNDDYLLLFLNTGRLNIYETTNWSLVFDEDIPGFKNWIEEIRAVQSADGKELLVFADPDSSSPRAAFIDMTDWKVMAEVRNACFYDPAQDRIYGTGGSGIFNCPLYGFEDLKEMAEDYLKANT